MSLQSSLMVSRDSLKNYWDFATLENRALIIEDLKKELKSNAKSFDFKKALFQAFDELPKPIARLIESRILNSFDCILLSIKN